MAIQSLYNFMDQMNNNSVRSTNLFEMRVFVPAALSNHAGVGGNSLTRFLNPNFTFYGTGFTLPNRSLEYQNVAFKGYTLPVPTVMRMAQEHTVTINADIKGEMRRAFMAWQALTMNPQIDQNSGYFEGNRTLNSSGKLYVHLLDPVYGNPQKIVETYTIFGVTVSDVGEMSFSNSEANIATFNVQFKSQYWQYGIDDTNAARTF